VRLSSGAEPVSSGAAAVRAVMPKAVGMPIKAKAVRTPHQAKEARTSLGTQGK